MGTGIAAISPKNSTSFLAFGLDLQPFWPRAAVLSGLAPATAAGAAVLWALPRLPPLRNFSLLAVLVWSLFGLVLGLRLVIAFRRCGAKTKETWCFNTDLPTDPLEAAQTHIRAQNPHDPLATSKPADFCKYPTNDTWVIQSWHFLFSKDLSQWLKHWKIIQPSSWWWRKKAWAAWGHPIPIPPTHNMVKMWLKKVTCLLTLSFICWDHENQSLKECKSLWSGLAVVQAVTWSLRRNRSILTESPDGCVFLSSRVCPVKAKENKISSQMNIGAGFHSITANICPHPCNNIPVVICRLHPHDHFYSGHLPSPITIQFSRLLFITTHPLFFAVIGMNTVRKAKNRGNDKQMRFVHEIRMQRICGNTNWCLSTALWADFNCIISDGTIQP